MSMAGSLKDILLDILGNKTRRRILELLSEEPRYLLQLSKELGVSMPAIQRHLGALEEGSMVDSFEKESDLGGPRRRYYRLRSSIYLTASITGGFVKIETFPIVVEKVSKEVLTEFAGLQRKVRELRETTNHNERLKKSDALLNQVDDTIRRLDDKKVFLLSLKHKISRIASETIRQISETELERRILHRVVGSGAPPTPELISAQLEIRERTIEDVLKELGQKGIRLSSETNGR